MADMATDEIDSVGMQRTWSMGKEGDSDSIHEEMIEPNSPDIQIQYFFAEDLRKSWWISQVVGVAIRDSCGSSFLGDFQCHDHSMTRWHNQRPQFLEFLLHNFRVAPCHFRHFASVEE